ncbi:MAG: serine acetyltransferase, partial [Saprospiraceae bacterium]
MQPSFLQHLFHLHASTPKVPSSEAVCNWIDGLLGLLFPELAHRQFEDVRSFEHAFAHSMQELYRILKILEEELPAPVEEIEQLFVASLPAVHRLLEGDAQAILAGDPAANSLTEVIRTYPGFYAI